MPTCSANSVDPKMGTVMLYADAVDAQSIAIMNGSMAYLLGLFLYIWKAPPNQE